MTEAGTELEAAGRRFVKMLVTTLRAGNLFFHRERRRVRTVAGVTVYARVEFDPVEGEPDHLDFKVHSPEARQWASKGVPVPNYLNPRSQDELEAGWEARDAAAAAGRPPYPTT